jgi:hypothetical protein
MDWMILPVDFTGIGTTQQEPFRATTECPYVRWDMIAIGIGIGAIAVYLWRK